jgi:hypothetical protein
VRNWGENCPKRKGVCKDVQRCAKMRKEEGDVCEIGGELFKEEGGRRMYLFDILFDVRLDILLGSVLGHRTPQFAILLHLDGTAHAVDLFDGVLHVLAPIIEQVPNTTLGSGGNLFAALDSDCLLKGERVESEMRRGEKGNEGGNYK